MRRKISFEYLMTYMTFLNSRSLNQAGFKKALCKQNLTKFLNFLQFADIYISGLLCDIDGPQILDSPKKCGFLGFKICIASSIKIAKDLVMGEKAPLYYFPFYKVSQDHLELFFSSVRFHGGCYDNPTARQFRAAYKKLLVTAELKSSKSGNCIPLSDISILSVPSHLPPESVVNLTTPYHKESGLPFPVLEKSDAGEYYLQRNLGECSTDIVYYVAGYLCRKLEGMLKCASCIAALRAETKPSRITFVSFKSNGKSVHPSSDVFKLCKISEAVFRKESSSTSQNKVKK